jgi:hypothetical protein
MSQEVRLIIIPAWLYRVNRQNYRDAYVFETVTINRGLRVRRRMTVRKWRVAVGEFAIEVVRFVPEMNGRVRNLRDWLRKPADSSDLFGEQGALILRINLKRGAITYG